MKDQFIKKDGKLFLKCEPEPLEMDSKMPCLARLICDDSPMGTFNKSKQDNYVAKGCGIVKRFSLQYPQHGYIDWEHNEYMHYSRFEIVGKHCPEGSREWALWQMLNGKAVTSQGGIIKAVDWIESLFWKLNDTLTDECCGGDLSSETADTAVKVFDLIRNALRKESEK